MTIFTIATTTMSEKRGGPRKGAGRPAGSTTTERTETLMVRVTPEERAKAEAIGNGNASKGLRIALAAFSR